MKQYFKLKISFVFVVMMTLMQSHLFAQVPTNGIIFQAVARDQYANPAKDRKIFVQSSIIQSNENGVKVLIEEHETTTDASGVFSISVGNGKRIGGIVTSLNLVDWAQGPYFLNLKIAITPIAPVTGWDYTKDLIDLGTSPFGSVPYALYAGNVFGLDKKLNIADSTKYVTPAQLNAKTFDQTPILNSIATKINLADSLIKYVTPAQLNAKTFDSSAIYNQMNLRESLSNKSTSILTDAASDAKYPSVKSIKTYVDTQIAGATIADADGATKGKIQLAGDLTGNAGLPIVANNAITTAKIADNNVTDAKIVSVSGSKVTGNISGNAATATKIATPVTINGVSFDGSSNITIASAAANGLTMNASGTGDASGAVYDGASAKTISYNTIGASPLAGSSSLTTVGTIETGVWSGTAIAISNGGTGSTIKNFVDLSTTQTIGGPKTFSDQITLPSIVLSNGTLTVPSTSTWQFGTAPGSTSLSLYQGGCCGRVTIDDNGRFAIGANYAPTTFQFDVEGNGRFTQDLTASSFIGNLTGNASTATNAGNITATSNSTLTSLINLKEVGTIETGVWSGTAIANNKLANSALTIGSTNIELGNTATTLSGLTSVTSTGFTGDLIGNVSGSLSGNASTATKLISAKNINGVPFDGSADITVAAAANTLTGTTLANTVVSSSLTSVGTITSGVWSGTAIEISKGGTGATSASAALTNLGAEAVANKSTDIDMGGIGSSDLKYPSQLAVKTYVSNQFASGGVADNSITNAKLFGGITASKLVGTDINTVGTITSGIWNGTTIAVANGGTGATSLTGYLKGNGTSAFTASTSIPVADVTNAESILNRATATDLGDVNATDSKYPSQLAVKTYVDTKVAAATIADADASTKGKIQLTGDLGNSATLPRVVSVGGSTAANINTAEQIANAATDANTAGTVVKRNSSGNFSAGTITANLVGDVTGNVSGNASNVTGMITGANGGTGINNGSKTMTIGGDFVTTGTGALSLTYSGTTNVTLPATGTLATLNGSENLNNKTINGLTLNSQSTGFSINGGTISKTLTLADDATLSGSNTGDQTITLTGDLSGSGTGILSATLSNTGVAAGTYGSATTVPNFTVDAKGRITNVSNTTITGVSPIGASLASGKLYIGDAAGAAQAIAVSGDFTINSSGVGTISATSVTNNMLAGGIDLTTKVTGALPVANGGTGATNLSGYIKGSGTSAFTSSTSIPVADVTGAVVRVNGVQPDGNGNVTVPTVAVITGTYTEFTTLRSGTYTGTAGTTFVVSQDAANNGRTFIFEGNNNTWHEITTNQSATDARYLIKSGDVMSGVLTVPRITINTTPSASSDATTKSYVDDLVSNATPSATASVTGKIQLAGDLGGSATFPNVVSVGGATASDIANATTLANAATASNTSNKIVMRDVSGNFAAGTITANLVGNVTGNVSGNATNVTGVVAVANGGSGASTLTGYIKGNGTNAFTAAAAIPVADVTNAETNTNKSSATDLGGASASNTNYPTQLAVKSYVDTKVAAATIADADANTKGKIQLAGDLGNTAASPTVLSVGGSSASNINTATVAANAATASNTSSTIVKRDASGNFSAGMITANLTGNVTGNVSGNAANVTGIILGANGGTGVANSGKTITLGGNLITAGAYSTTFNVSNNTNINLPTSGTLSTLAGVEAFTNKTINGLTPTSQTTGFTIAGGNTNSKTLTVSNDANVSGTNTGDQTITLTGDLTGSGTGSFNTTLSNSGVTAGTYGSSTAIPTLTIDSKGRITSANTTSIVAGVNTVNTIAASSSANGATISGTSITLTPADATNGGIVTNGAQTFAGAKTFNSTITGSISGNAGTATKLQTGRTIAITGDLTYTSPSFDGTGNVTAVGTLANSGVVSGTYGSSTAIPSLIIDSKGRITSATTTSIIAGVNTVASIAGTSNAAGATISGTTITLTPADGTNGGVVTNGAQTFAGVKTFSNNTASTSTTTGAVVATGGLGVGGAIYAGSIQNTPIGSTTASTGAFTTLSASGVTTLTSVTATGAATFSSTVKIPTGAAANKVLTSDASGNATWTYGSSSVSKPTASATISISDKYVFYEGTADGTLTLPAATGNAGKEIIIKNKTTKVVTVSRTGTTETIFVDSANTAVTSFTIGSEASNNWVKLVSDGANWVVFRALF